MKLNRRQFLAGLVALGATVALPVSVAKASTTQVNQAWQFLLHDPWCFTVDGEGTIVTTGEKEPEKRNEVFDVDLSAACSVESLMTDIENCEPLASHFRSLADIELDEIQDALDESASLTLAERRQLNRLAAVLVDEWDGWKDWMRINGVAGLEWFKDEAKEWLARDIQIGDREWISPHVGAQGGALGFFESLPTEALRALGVVIVDGDLPGSTYYAAELRKPIDAANEAAAALGLPFHFHLEGSSARVSRNKTGA